MEGSRTATILIEYHLSYIEYHFSYYGGRKAVFDQLVRRTVQGVSGHRIH
jgi:hypothetical protein